MNRAMPTAIGTATAMAMTDDTTVPKARTAMPNSGGVPVGFHSRVVKKLASFLLSAIEAR